MSEEFVKSVLKEHAEANTQSRRDPWLAIEARLQSVQTERRPRWAINLRPATVAMLGAMSLVLLLLGTVLLVEQPRAVSAEAIFAQAEKASKDGSAAGLISAYAVSQYRRQMPSFPGVEGHSAAGGVIEGRVETWYEAPDKLASESRSTMPDGTELEGIGLQVGGIVYGTLSGHEEIRIMQRKEDAVRAFSPVDTEQLFSRPTRPGPIEKPYTVTLVGDEQVAGRAAYVLEWNVTPEVLEAEAAGDYRLNSHKYRLWIDQQFYLILKLQGWDKDGVLIEESHVERLELNKPVDPSLFLFKPPAGYVVADMRPASAKDVAEGWRETSRQVTFTLYEPTGVVSNTRQLRKPYYVASQGVVTQAVVGGPADHDVLHALVVQGPPSAVDESQLGSGTQVPVGSRQGRLYKRNEAHYLVFDIDGTRIMLYSSNMGEGGSVERDLVRVGESLMPVGKK
ncbi:MAG TPA: sigma-E factor regulatory protein RseB domain-containing protein [Chloroflexia bacterium]|jgi:hypothetical protein